MFSLIGNQRGRRSIRWGCVLLAGVLTSLVAGGVAAGLYAAYTQSWNPAILLLGPAVGLVGTFLTLLAALRTPLQRLPLVK